VVFRNNETLHTNPHIRSLPHRLDAPLGLTVACRVADPARDDQDLIARLRLGDEAAFTTLIDRHHRTLRRLARAFVSSDAVAEEVVQDTWVAVLDRLGSFEARSSLKTWIFRILINRAKTRGVREARTVPMSAMGSDDEEAAEASVDPARFDDRGMWSSPPQRWEDSPAKLLLQKELAGELERAIAQLPERQRSVVVMRDALGWSSEEVCNVLELNETNQRVLLHRARSRLRAMLEHYKAQG
jgi:RNA polymerase sigma-70 factor, ECF subfamily